MVATIRIRISGTAFSTMQGSELYSSPERYDRGSEGSRDACAALQAAKRVAVGYGYSYWVELTKAAAETIAEYCHTVGETFAMEADRETRAEGRALLVTARKIERESATAFDEASA